MLYMRIARRFTAIYAPPRTGLHALPPRYAHSPPQVFTPSLNKPATRLARRPTGIHTRALPPTGMHTLPPLSPHRYSRPTLL